MHSVQSLLTSITATVALTLSVPNTSWADDPIPVVATFSVLGDMVKRIGGEHISLTTLVGADGDTHVYQPTPQAARVVAEADVLFINGLGVEGWLERLVEAAPFAGSLVVATTGIEPIAFGDHDDHEEGHEEGHEEATDHHGEHGAFDPHAWHSFTNAIIYANNIAAGLAQVDPTNAGFYYQNHQIFVNEIRALKAEADVIMAALPIDKRTVVTPHDGFGYFADLYNLRFEAPQGLSTESEASAADVAKLILLIRKQEISAVFIESITDNRLMEQIANETGAVIGGKLYSDALSSEDQPASTYLDMMRHNTKTLSQALGD
ncbi:MAG: zinc ABC transporter solute-binding protein [Oceanospirillaceae bacterium]|nr:zinc ABC transporter solute-binding protein [Oceanospirillaceae bacterium]